MNITLHHPTCADRVRVPTSKSAAHRLLIAAAFADRPTTVHCIGMGEDIGATLRCLVAMGADITITHDKKSGADRIAITPIDTPLDGAVADCGESGSTLRFLVPVAAALGISVRFLRRGRLPQRPMSPLAELLAEVGVTLTDNDDGSLSVLGKLTAGNYSIPANVSSQFITGLLFALSLLEGESTLTLTGEIESAPYIEMTLRALAAFGVTPCRLPDGRTFRIKGKQSEPFLARESDYFPEGDFSGAAFPLAAGAVGTHPVTVCGLSLDTPQGDSAILDLLERFGASVTRDAASGSVTVSPAPLHGIEIDAKQIPDLVPVLAVVAANATGVTRIFGASRLALKESDRLATTAALLTALGGTVTKTNDGLTVTGGTPLTGGIAEGACDHRIVMSAAVAALTASGAVTVSDTEAVSKSYPSFFSEVIIPS